MSQFEDETILVTGGTGSIGSEIVNQLCKSNVKNILVFSRDEIKSLMLKKRISDERVKTFVGDIRTKSSLRRIFLQYNIDRIFHAAAMKHVIVSEQFPYEAVLTNVKGTQNICDIASEFKVSNLITISTDKAVNPMNVMGASKFIAERITINSGYSCVRFGNVANSRGSVIPVMIDSILREKVIRVTEPKVTRFIMRISEAVNLVLKATEISEGEEIFILKMEAFELGDLVSILKNKVAPLLGIPAKEVKVINLGLFPGEKLHEELINYDELNKLVDKETMYIVKPNESPSVKNKYTIDQFSSKNAKKIDEEKFLEIILQFTKNFNIRV